MSSLGTDQNPMRAAIVGSGPSGFYATEALLKAEPVILVDMFERLPSPFGLVRSGVAPDHPKLKQPILVYQRIAESPEFRFLGNVTVGRDVSVQELAACYHAVVFTCGAETDRKLGIPGEELPGSHTATEFVGWYNGHPDYCDRVFDLSHENAVVIGQGNVAVDVCRILSKTVDELRHTDIAKRALEVLAESKVRDIYMIGRRGPAQAKFTHTELRELGKLEDCDPVVDPRDLELNPASQEELADRRNRANIKSCEVLQEFASRAAPTRWRRCHIQFLKSPTELRGERRLERVVLVRNRLEGEPSRQVARETGETEELACGVLFRSIGYRGVPIAGVPFDDDRGIFPNREGRIVDGQNVVPGLYAAGWIKRGPTGIIGTNREDGVATVNSLLADLPHLGAAAKPGADGLQGLLKDRGVRVVSYADWQKIDAAEVRRGAAQGKPREKFTRVAEMLAALDQN
ncbi:MAG: NADP oxidoreductase [Gammaproteobacteria bacterium]|nr:NADP oxidoreductase [Gammaproteobacteria bacterium]NIR82401.1 NADP oxidoreductase [Gammaproteobacteria bacterium]NIR91982.1 NADP oxidoreductase [Gammaproteobacteria bacterium]NIU03538.1 NADP oxidoreductase [Gammaproteobacteria bacterium]NIX84812.1 NADP oxidoreductase [Gammaproteobacteria bacterium]